jgi:probable rRNA maturation factor
MNTVEIDSNIEESEEVPLGLQIDWLKNVVPFVEAALARLDIDDWELSVLFCADPFIAALNKQYRGIEAPTDVLSFSQEDTHIAGDIVISVDTLARNARDFKVPADEELKRLLVHGILHLAGYDHGDSLLPPKKMPTLSPKNKLGTSPQQEMLALQERVLTELSDYSIINKRSFRQDTIWEY